MNNKCLLFISFLTIIIFNEGFFVHANNFPNSINNNFPNYNPSTQDNFYERFETYSKEVDKKKQINLQNSQIMQLNRNYALIAQNSLSSATHFSLAYQIMSAIFRRPQTRNHNRLVFTSIFDIIQFSVKHLRKKRNNDNNKS